MVMLDQETRKRVPGAAKMFFEPPYHMSASFDSPYTGEEQKVHINPNQSVRLVRDKARLYNHLDKAGYNVGNYAPTEKFVRGGTFDLPKFEEAFPSFPDNSVQIVTGNKGQNKELSDTEELFDFIPNIHKHEGAVFRQPKIEMPNTAFIRTIPGADGMELNTGPRAVKDGVLAHNVSNGPHQAAMLAAAKEATKKTGLHYACVFVQYDPNDKTGGSLEMLDIVSNFRAEDAIALRAYADVLHKQQNRPKQFQGHGKRK